MKKLSAKFSVLNSIFYGVICLLLTIILGFIVYNELKPFFQKSVPAKLVVSSCVYPTPHRTGYNTCDGHVRVENPVDFEFDSIARGVTLTNAQASSDIVDVRLTEDGQVYTSIGNLRTLGIAIPATLLFAVGTIWLFTSPFLKGNKTNSKILDQLLYRK